MSVSYRGMSVHIRENATDRDLVSAADNSKDLSEIDSIIGSGANLARKGDYAAARHHVEACGPIVDRLALSARAAESARDELRAMIEGLESTSSSPDEDAPNLKAEFPPEPELDPSADEDEHDASLSEPPRRRGRR